MSLSGNPTIVVSRPKKNNDVPTTTSAGVTIDVAPANKFQYLIKLTNATVTLLRTSASIASGSITLCTFPIGLNDLTCVTMRLKTIAADGASLTAANLVVGIGSTAAGVDNGTLTSTEVDFLPSTAAAMAASAAGPIAARSSARLGYLNGQSTATVLRLNFATSDDVASTRTLTINGWVLVTGEMCGDTSQDL
jgi:hypothetical protein